MQCLLSKEVLLAACGADRAILSALAKGLGARLESDVRALRALHAEGRLEQLRNSAHTLCGMVASCSTSLAQVVSEIEDAAAHADVERAATLIAQVESVITTFARELETVQLEDLRSKG